MDTIATIKSYAHYLRHDPGFVDMFATVPWLLDGVNQGKDTFLLALENEAGRLAEFDGPLISVVTPTWNTEPAHMRQLIACMRAQTYQHWEWLIVDDGSTDRSHLPAIEQAAAQDQRIRFIQNERNGGISAARNTGLAAARGQWVGIVDHDDLLHPQALGIMARKVVAEPGLNFIYSNEVKLSDDGRRVSDFLSKPQFNFETLLRVNYIAHFMVVQKSLLDELGEAPFRSEFDGAEDHDLFLRLAQRPGFSAGMVPLFLYYWRRAATSTAEVMTTKPGAVRAAESAVSSILGRAGLSVRAGSLGDQARNLVIRRQVPASARLLAIVPFRDSWQLTEKCLKSLEKQEFSGSVTVALVDNQSQVDTVKSVEAWHAEQHRWQYADLGFDGAFNFAKLNNLAVAEHGDAHDYVLLLNNDVELLSTDAIAQMVAHLAGDERMAFCGMKLLFPDMKSIQHGGIKVRAAISGSGFRLVGHIDSAQEYAHDDHVVMAVSFACAMSRVSTYRDLGGLEEHNLPNGYGDVDLCLKASEAGLYNFYLGTLSGTHHESPSRKHRSEDYEFSYLCRRHQQALSDGRIYQFGYDLHHPWRGVDSLEADWVDLPLRYRLADKVNDRLKSLKPIHGWIRRQLGPQA